MHYRPPVVLIVDDHPDSLAMYAFGLVAMGFQAVTARTGADAFERACQLLPDVIVTDELRPGDSGLDLTRRLRHDTRTKNVGIIVLAGPDTGSAEKQAGDAGCDRFILKPCPPDALAIEIQAVLTDRRRAI